jgi:hypothetical protein
MNEENYLNFRKLNLDLKLYRYVRLSTLYEILDSHHNQLSHPALWGDPFENLTLNGKAQYRDGSIRSFEQRDHVYAQCWTLEQRSDAMWRIYCPADQNSNFCGVRIRSSLHLLANSLAGSAGVDAKECVFVGKVCYLTDKALDRMAHSLFAKGVTPVAIARSLLLKRTAFRHEREVRLIYSVQTVKKAEDRRFRYRIDPEKFITQIMVAPRRSAAEAEDLKQIIRSRTAGNIEVKRSLLYKKPQGLTFHIEDE